MSSRGTGKSLLSVGSNNEEKAPAKPATSKPLSKKEKEQLRRQEQEMKEKILQLRKEADAMLAEFQAMLKASKAKAATEEAEHRKRVPILTSVLVTFKEAFNRLKHEKNKLREQMLWKRYLIPDHWVTPKFVQNLNTRLHLWKNSESSIKIDYLFDHIDGLIDALRVLDDFILNPALELPRHIETYIEIRRDWRDAVLKTLDAACFRLIKDLKGNFSESSNPNELIFEIFSNCVKLGMTALLEVEIQDKLLAQLPRSNPKICFPSMNVTVVLPKPFRKKAVILRLIYSTYDFFSFTSYTWNLPQTFQMENDLLGEANRIFEAKNEAKASVADREREKVTQAKQKVAEMRSAATLAEKKFEDFQNVTKDVGAPPPPPEEVSSQGVPEAKKKKGGRIIETFSMPDAPVATTMKKQKGVFEDRDSMSIALSFMGDSTDSQKTLDSISIRSGMKKRDRHKTMSVCLNNQSIGLFQTQSMLACEQQNQKVQAERGSEMGFEEAPEDSNSGVSKQGSDYSLDSLDMLFGNCEEDQENATSLKTQVRNTTITREVAAIRSNSKGPSIGDVKKGKKGTKNDGGGQRGSADNTILAQTASEIFEAKENIRQETYDASLVMNDIPRKKYHVNLRASLLVGGVWCLDVLQHAIQPTQRKDYSVQVFYGEQTVQREKYEFNVVPSRHEDTTEEVDPAEDAIWLDYAHITAPLPTHIKYFDPPFVALWDEENKFWTQEFVHNFQIDEESKKVTFHAGRIWPFAFFTYKFYLLPFTSWNIKFNYDTNGIDVKVQCEHAQFFFTVKNFAVRLTSIEGVSESYCESILGKFMILGDLVAKMKELNLNIFPDDDTFLYVNVHSVKEPILEDHAYMSIAMMSDSVEFASSRWNSEFKRNKLAFMARESMNLIALRWRTVTSTSFHAYLYRINEDDDTFDESKVEHLTFQPDVYSLLTRGFKHSSKNEDHNARQIVQTYEFLRALRLLSYCASAKKRVEVESAEKDKGAPAKAKSKRAAKTPVVKSKNQSSPRESKFSM